MKPRLLHFFTVLSLLLCVAVVALWVRSYWWDLEFHWDRVDERPGFTTEHRRSLECEGGRIMVQWGTVGYATTPEAIPGARRNVRRERPVRVETGPYLPAEAREFRYVRDSLRDFQADRIWGSPDGKGRYDISYVLFPHWLPIVPLAALPAWRLWRRRRERRRLASNACPKCGYDLRATPGRCPECGHAAAEGSATGGTVRTAGGRPTG